MNPGGWPHFRPILAKVGAANSQGSATKLTRLPSTMRCRIPQRRLVTSNLSLTLQPVPLLIPKLLMLFEKLFFEKMNAKLALASPLETTELRI